MNYKYYVNIGKNIDTYQFGNRKIPFTWIRQQSESGKSVP